MTQQLLRLLTAVILPAALCFAGCAGMNNTFDGIKKNIADLRREKPPIATSLKQMPEDARAITCAIYKNITMVHHDGDLMPVNFTGTAMSQFSSDQKVLQNFTLTGAHLYEHEPSHIKGALFLEDAVGRRSSLSYDATYQRTGENIIIDTIELTPIYSPDPEPVLLVVPADRIPSNPADLPSSHTGMLQFAAVRAVNPTQPEDGFYGIREYVVMAFFLDRISPTAKFDLKVSKESVTYEGYNKATRYMDFDGWRLALLSGKFRLFADPAHSVTTPGGDEGETRLYFKAIYTPGKESGLIRISRMVGVFCAGGPQG
ncbi:MAG TPA: hypothetical protein PKV75_11910 [Desulfobacterales bacterium]|nr:hypothetical protein [Desulfobacterales bacterium]